MSARRSVSLVAAAAMCTLCVTTAAEVQSQSVARQVAAVRDGTVRLSFPARAGVCGNGSTWVRTSEGSYTGSWRGGRDVEMDECQPGPVRVVVERQGGASQEIRTYVGGRWRTDASASDLGTVTAAGAIDWLMDEIRDGRPTAAEGAFLPLNIADAPIPWMGVLDVARETSRPREVRSQALFWAGRAAGDKAADDIGAIAASDPDVEVRKQAVFALSRMPNGVDQLIRIARTSKDREVKKSAYFWLGQSKDPRATELFAEVLGSPMR